MLTLDKKYDTKFAQAFHLKKYGHQFLLENGSLLNF